MSEMSVAFLKVHAGFLALTFLIPACSDRADRPVPAMERASVANASADSSAKKLWLIAPSGDTADINANTSPADLVRRFGEANLRAAEINIGEGVTMRGDVLFPDDSIRRVEIVWIDVKSRARPARLQLSGSRSLWAIAPGISLGTSLTEIERYNGGPVTLTGFGWDFGGVITNFRGGRLVHLKGRTPNVFLQLHPSVHADDRAQQLRASVQGDHEFGSEIAAMQSLNPRVHLIIISYEAR